MIELLIVTVILPIIVAAVAYALIAVFSLQGGATSRLTNTDDAQTVSATYETDVQSATLITTMTTSSPQCGTSGPQLLGLQWTTSSGTPVVVSYEEAGSGPYDLVRNYCTGSPATLTSSSAVSFNLPSGQKAASCTTTANCSAMQGGWISAAGVSDITLAISETGSGPDGKSGSVGAFSYSLVATPGVYLAQFTGSSGGGSPIYPLALLGNPAPSSCSPNPSPTLNMTGTATIETEPSGSLPIYVASNCPSAITLIPGQTLKNQVSGIITNDPNTTTPGSDSYCDLANKNGSTCDPTQLGPPESAPPTGSVIDPLANLSPPSNPTQGQEFTTAQSWSSAGDVPNFTSGGTYIFDQNVSISRAVTVDFPPGTYWFKGGLTMAQDTVTFGSGTYLFGNSATQTTCVSTGCLSTGSGGSMTTDNTSGVLFYVESGAVNFGGGSSVSISTGQSGSALYNLYSGVALWDAAPTTADATALTITAGASADNFGGIYDPKGDVVLSGNGGALNVAFLEAYEASMGGSSTLTLGQ